MPTLETRTGTHLPDWSTLNVDHTHVIDRFTQQYHFLSNFYRVPIVSGKTGTVFPTVENAFQWSKAYYARDLESMQRLGDVRLSPGDAKKLGALVTNIPATWQQMRVKVMLHLLTLKFAHAGLAGLLRKTAGYGTTPGFRLVEGNYWHDNFWGICSCKACPGHGHNILGKQLEKVRESLTAPAPQVYFFPAGTPLPASHKDLVKVG